MRKKILYKQIVCEKEKTPTGVDASSFVKLRYVYEFQFSPTNVGVLF